MRKTVHSLPIDSTTFRGLDGLINPPNVHRTGPEIVCLDLSWNTCGIYWGPEDVFTVIFKSDITLYGRVNALMAKILGHGAPGLCCFEGYSYGSRGIGITDMAELRGTIKYLLHCRQIPVIDVAPTQLKKFITGSGNAAKDKIALVLYKRYGVEFADTHQADAFSMYQLCIAVMRCQIDPTSLQAYTAPQQAVIKQQIKNFPSRSQ